MPPMKLTASERTALKQLAVSPRPASEIRSEFAEKFVSEGLAVRQALWLSITTKGQLELLRQRYRALPAHSEDSSDSDAAPGFVSKFEERLARGLTAPRQPAGGADPE